MLLVDAHLVLISLVTGPAVESHEGNSSPRPGSVLSMCVCSRGAFQCV